MKHVHKRPLNVVKLQLPVTQSDWKKLSACKKAELFADEANEIMGNYKLDSLRIAKFNLRDPSVTFSQKMGDTLAMFFVVGEFIPELIQDEEESDDTESTAVSCES